MNGEEWARALAQKPRKPRALRAQQQHPIENLRFALKRFFLQQIIIKKIYKHREPFDSCGNCVFTGYVIIRRENTCLFSRQKVRTIHTHVSAKKKYTRSSLLSAFIISWTGMKFDPLRETKHSNWFKQHFNVEKIGKRYVIKLWKVARVFFKDLFGVRMNWRHRHGYVFPSRKSFLRTFATKNSFFLVVFFQKKNESFQKIFH